MRNIFAFKISLSATLTIIIIVIVSQFNATETSIFILSVNNIGPHLLLIIMAEKPTVFLLIP